MSNQQTKENNMFNIQAVYNVSQGNLLNGVKKLKGYNFVSYIGGNNNGFSEVIINVTNSCGYYLLLNYVCYEPNLSFKINVNGIEDNKIYYTNFLSQWSINMPLTFTIPITLNSGDNVIKFYGNGNNKAPYLGEFIVALPKVTNDLSKGVLENNAYVDSNTNFVNAIGGPKDGAVIITVNVNAEGIYTLLIQYISDNLKPLKIDINGIQSKEIYNLIASDIEEGVLTKTFTTSINLNAGNNTLKFHGDSLNYSPNLGPIKIYEIKNIDTSIFLVSNTHNVSNGTLGNGAIIDKNNMVTNLGGLQDGYSIVKVPVEILGKYEIKLNYMNGKAPFKISINGIETETIYKVNENKSGVFSVSLSLVAGINELKFHGNGKDEAPNLGSFTINLLKDESSEFLLGNTLNGASVLSKGVLTGLGGINDGKYVMNYIASDFGWYDIYITVATSEGSILALDVNLNNKDFIYNIPKSDGISVFIISFLLEKGKNTLIFHGDYVNTVPDILKIEMKLSKPIKDSIYNFVDGTLENGAIKNLENNLVSGIGGINNGYVTIEVNINEEGLYDFNIKYLPEKIDVALKIDIIDNKNVNTSTICILSANFLIADSFNLELDECIITLSLNKGKNYIKFFGNGIDIVPQLSYVKISKSYTQQAIELFKKTYSLAKLAIERGVAIDNTNPNFINGLGKENPSYFSLYLDLQKASEYKIDIKYLKLNEDEKLYIDFGNGDKESFNPPKTNSLKEQDTKVITVNKFLRTKSYIHFLKHDSYDTPLLGDVTITEIKLPSIKPYTILSIEFHNGTQKYGVEDFITFIGGPKKGFITLIIKSENSGIFDLGFKYLCGFNERILSVDINEDKLSNIYKVPLTQDWEIINAQTFTIPLRLKRGNNIIKFAGDIDKFAPIIGNFNLDLKKDVFSMRYDTSVGILKNGAKVNNYGLVTNIGGPNKGEVTIKVDVKNSGKYNGILEYKPIGKYTFIEAVVNDKIFYFENNMENNDWSLSDLPTLKIRINLKKGSNIINFRGLNSTTISNDYSPFLGAFTLIGGYSEFVVDKTLSKGSYDLTKGKIENNVHIIGDFIENLGFSNKASVTMKVSVESRGIYFMTLIYRTDKDSFLRFDINEEEDGKIYFFEKTKCIDNEAEFRVMLKKGENTIKFYGVEKMFAPSISIISIKKLTI